MRAKRFLCVLTLAAGLIAGVVLSAGDRAATAAESVPAPVVASYWDID
jgi:hypothetical protein